MSGQAQRAERLSGIVVILFGAVLYWAIVPWQVETADYGWLRPRTLPRILAVILMLAGAWQVLGASTPPDARAGAVPWARGALFAAVLIASLALMAQVGFLVVAPVMALTIMLLTGERRPLWLGLGTLGAPAAIWLGVAVLLERPLP